MAGKSGVRFQEAFAGVRPNARRRVQTWSYDPKLADPGTEISQRGKTYPALLIRRRADADQPYLNGTVFPDVPLACKA
jgi:hypothetical protein